MGWLAAFRRELRWLGGALGAARDADVRVMNLEAASAKLSPADQGAAARVVEAARSEQSLAHQKLLEAMDSERYLVVLRCLDAVAGRAGATQASSTTGLAAPPEQLWRHLEVPASSAMAHLGARQWRSARRAVRRLGNPPSDEALHRLRIETKRLRYIAEVAAPVLRPAPSRRAAQAMAAAATDLQDVLGGLHDSVVSEQWLRDLAARPVWGAEGASGDLGTAAATAGSAAAAAGNDTAAGAGSDLALVAGELVAAARSTAAACRATWEQKWRRLERKELAKWLAGGR
jgi:CHAD domain-containing protein